MNSTSVANTVTHWYWSDHATAGLTRYGVHVATTPLRCAQQLYFVVEQIVYTLYAAPWKEKLPGCITVMTMGARSVLLDLFHLLDPLYGWRMKVCEVPNLPALQWGSPFGLGVRSMTETQSNFSWLCPARPTAPLNDNITNGHCWGISLRVAQLFFEWQDAIIDPEERLLLIVRRFSYGATNEAQHLQAMGCTQMHPRIWESALLVAQIPLRLTWTVLKASTAWVRQNSFSLALYQARCRYSIAWQEGAMLPQANLGIRGVRSINHTNDLARVRKGVYLVRQGIHDSHEMVYIKLSNQLSFTLNPGWGLYRHTGKTSAQSAAHALGVGGHQQIHLIRVARHTFLDSYPVALPWRRSTLFV